MLRLDIRTENIYSVHIINPTTTSGKGVIIGPGKRSRRLPHQLNNTFKVDFNDGVSVIYMVLNDLSSATPLPLQQNGCKSSLILSKQNRSLYFIVLLRIHADARISEILRKWMAFSVRTEANMYSCRCD